MASAMTRGAAKHATNLGACALFVCLIAVSATAAVADERPVLVIDSTATAEGRAMVTRIEKHLGPDPRLATVPERFREAASKPTATDTSWTAEEATLAETRKLLTPIGYRQAAEKARAAQDRLARYAGERGLDAARPLFLLVHRLTPGRTLDPGRYLPEVVKAFAAASITGASGKVTITAVGADEVLVDGVVVPGGEPVDSHPVPAGPHIITVRGDRVVTTGRRVDVTAASTLPVDFKLVGATDETRIMRARDRLVAARDDGARNVALRDLLSTIKPSADAVVVVREGGDAGEMAVRLFTDQGGLGPPRVVGDDVAGAIAPLRPIRKPPPRNGSGRPGGGIGRTPEVPPDEPWYTRSWFKATSGTIAGVAAVVLITAIVTRDPGTSTLSGPGVDVE
jgi:hypothetical protein